MSRIRGRLRPERSGNRTGLWRETADGIRMVWSDRLLGAMVIQAPLTAGLLVEHFSGQWALAAFAVASGVAAILSTMLPGPGRRPQEGRRP